MSPERERDPSIAGVRLNRHLASCGVCSRRDADALISAGRVRINGQVIRELGVRVRPDDQVSVDGRRVAVEGKVWLLLNKPTDCITTAEDTHGRRTVLDLVRDACSERVYPVGRLDRDTTGLLLLTNDGDLAKTLAHPSSEVRKEYVAELDRPVGEAGLARLRKGVVLEDGFMRVDRAEAMGGDGRVIRVVIHSGRNRIVRRLFSHLGSEVIGLDRVRFGPLVLGGLARGAWRRLDAGEVRLLGGRPPG